MLHTLGRSPCLCDIEMLHRMLRPDDDLLLIQDGVLAAVNDSCFLRMFQDVSTKISALKKDLEARGLVDQISSKIDIVSYTDFVSLTIEHSSQMNW